MIRILYSVDEFWRYYRGHSVPIHSDYRSERQTGWKYVIIDKLFVCPIVTPSIVDLLFLYPNRLRLFRDLTGSILTYNYYTYCRSEQFTS